MASLSKNLQPSSLDEVIKLVYLNLSNESTHSFLLIMTSMTKIILEKPTHSAQIYFSEGLFFFDKGIFTSKILSEEAD